MLLFSRPWAQRWRQLFYAFPCCMQKDTARDTKTHGTAGQLHPEYSWQVDKEEMLAKSEIATPKVLRSKPFSRSLQGLQSRPNLAEPPSTPQWSKQKRLIAT